MYRCYHGKVYSESLNPLKFALRRFKLRKQSLLSFTAVVTGTSVLWTDNSNIKRTVSQQKYRDLRRAAAKRPILIRAAPLQMDQYLCGRTPENHLRPERQMKSRNKPEDVGITVH